MLTKVLYKCATLKTDPPKNMLQYEQTRCPTQKEVKAKEKAGFLDSLKEKYIFSISFGERLLVPQTT